MDVGQTFYDPHHFYNQFIIWPARLPLQTNKFNWYDQQQSAVTYFRIITVANTFHHLVLRQFQNKLVASCTESSYG
jgi:hypothetical protein